MVPWNVAPSASMILAVVRCARTIAVGVSSMRSRARIEPSSVPPIVTARATTFPFTDDPAPIDR